MLKILVKKQLMEVFSWLYKDKKSGKIRTSKGVIGYAILYLLLFMFLGAIFGYLAFALCTPMLSMDMGWLYWCIMGLLSIFLGVFGSVFNTYSSLYRAKDNDLLLSMPIPTSYILSARLSGVYAMGLMYELIVVIPTIIVWLIYAPFSVLGTINALLIPVVLSILILVLSAVLGWVVAVVAAKVKHKNILTVLVSLVFFAIYYYICGKAYYILESFIANAQHVGSRMKIIVYPLYHMGRAAEGNALSMLIFTVIIAGIFAVVYMILSRTFLTLATANKGSARTVRKDKAVKVQSVDSALLKKELKRFTGSANYMLNSGMGILMMIVAAVALIWKAEDIRAILTMISEDILPLIVVGAVCMLAAMNVITAPSVSLEGRNLWIVQSSPIPTDKILMAKMKLHILLTAVPAILIIAAFEWVVRTTIVFTVMIPIAVLLFIVFMASVGLMLNLKMPNLDWTNELVPIKQSAAVMLSLFGGWAAIIVLAIPYALLFGHVSTIAYLSLVCLLLLGADIVLLRWIKTKGCRIFESL